ncbi:hypothetical protein [Nitrospira sp. Nam80]
MAWQRNISMEKPLVSKDTLLPWNAKLVRMYAHLETYFATELPSAVTQYLPASITLFSDPEVDDTAIMKFLSTTTEFLLQEIRRRTIRRDKLLKLGLFTFEQMEYFLRARCYAQPWAIYYSKSGGLGALSEDFGMVTHGVIPCSAVRNHGVAWKFEDDDGLKIWLATARKEGREWDFDSDIGHESAHAAFAPIPLFAQEAHLSTDVAEFSGVSRLEELGPGHLGRLAYLYSEIAVVTIRGEQRPTQTGLPVPERKELLAFLEISHQLMPCIGFDQAISACERVNGPIDLQNNEEIFELAAPVIRILPYLTGLATSFKPPTLDWYRTTGAAATR